MEPQIKFRFDIQGLRAVAVLGVIIFHLNPKWLPGGFVGVDVFFVISGYLITCMLMQTLADEESIFKFYFRRLLRLVPAYFIMMASSAIAAYFFLFPKETILFAESLIASLFYLSNFYFAANINYFTIDPHLLPLLHTWSLSVEAQLYLIYPLIMYWLMKHGEFKLKATLIGLCLAMFGLNLFLTAHNQDLAYFAAPVRFYQFLAGALIVFLPSLNPLKWLMEVCLLLGLVLILGAFLFLNQQQSYPGINSLLPAIGSVLVILSGINQTLFTARLLSNKLMRFLGDISYSLYLWHLPVIVFYKIAVSSYLVSYDYLLVILISIVLSMLSWFFIEVNFRKSQQATQPFKTVTGVLLATILLAAVGLGYVISDGVRGRYSEQALYFSEYDFLQKAQQIRPTDGCVVYKNAIESFIEDKCINVSPGKHNLLLLGDSHAEQFRHVLHDQMDNINLSVVIVSGCRPGLPATGRQVCVDMLDRVYNDIIKRYQFDVVLVSARWTQNSIKAMPLAIKKLKESIDRVIILGPVVTYTRSLPRLLGRYGAGKDESIFFQKARRYKQEKQTDQALAIMAQEDAVEYVSVLDLMCPQGRCKTVSATGVPMQRDYGHLSYDGASELVGQMDILSE